MQITEGASERITEYIDKILIVPVLVNLNNEYAGLPKNMVLDPGWFNRNRIKSKNLWKRIRLFFKSN